MTSTQFRALLLSSVATGLVSTVGLFFYWRWARPLALIVAVPGLAVSPLLGPGLASGWSSALLEASFLSWGAVLALAYWSPIGQRFDRQPDRPTLAN